MGADERAQRVDMFRLVVARDLRELAQLAAERAAGEGSLIERLLGVLEPEEEVENANVLLFGGACRFAALVCCSKASKRDGTTRNQSPPEER